MNKFVGSETLSIEPLAYICKQRCHLWSSTACIFSLRLFIYGSSYESYPKSLSTKRIDSRQTLRTKNLCFHRVPPTSKVDNELVDRIFELGYLKKNLKAITQSEVASETKNISMISPSYNNKSLWEVLTQMIRKEEPLAGSDHGHHVTSKKVHSKRKGYETTNRWWLSEGWRNEK